MITLSADAKYHCRLIFDVHRLLLKGCANIFDLTFYFEEVNIEAYWQYPTISI